MQGITSQLWTVGDVARRLSIAPRTVARLVARGDLVAVKLTPGVLRFRPADVDDLIEARSTRTTTKES